MRKINFLFAIHCHQPVGNFEHVIEDAYKKSYLPFIQVLERYPNIKMTVHYTGILLTWFKEKHPEFLDMLKKLVKRGQIELMSGAYYEPIIAVIPDRDKIGQIKKQTDFIKKHLDFDPKGMWLAERIWEPHLPKSLSEAGIDYTAVDDYHFISAGVEEKDLNGYYITEEQGSCTKIFPISKQLRYLIPFKLPHETIDYLRSIATEEGTDAAILADDGEKFGVWPGTYKWVYEEKYLENLFNLLSQESSWIKTMTFSEYIKECPPKGRIYLPTASYFEMMEWSLLLGAGKKFDRISRELKNSGKLEDYKQFFKGGFWRNFFVKYPESNNMHKKMLLVSKKIETVSKKFKTDRAEHMLDELWQGQCNCPYWHGVFGGLYLNYLRHAIYEHLINAEKAADQLIYHNRKWIDAEITDFDKDGYDEVLISTEFLNLYFDPDNGGSLFELDYKPKSFNLTNTFTRKEEVYHKDVLRSQAHQLTLTGTSNGTASIHDTVRVKEVGLDKLLTYDWYRRACFMEHFLAEGTTLADFAGCSYRELGDFVNKPYIHEIKYGKNRIEAVFTREGHIKKEGREHPVKIKKTFVVCSENSQIDVAWEITNTGDRDISYWMGIEYNFSLLAGNAPDRYYVINGKKPADPTLASAGEDTNTYEISLIDKWSGISIIIEASRRSDLWRFPIETVSQSEGGFERTYQNSAMLSHWKTELKAGASETYSIKFKISEGAF